MKKLSLLFLLLLLSIISCKEDHPILEESETQSINKETLSLDIKNRTYSSSGIENIFSERSYSDLAAGTRTDLSLEAKIANQILFEIEEEVPFIEEFLKDYGKPYWEYGYVNKKPGTFNVAIPVIKDDEITSVFSFMQLDKETISFNFTSVEFNSSVKHSTSSITQSYINHVLEELAVITGKKLVDDEASLRTGCCQGGNLVSVTNMGGSWVISPYSPGSLCFCVNYEGSEQVSPTCCQDGGGEQVDGGAAEAGSDGATSSIPGENWIIFHSYWLNLWNGINTPSTGIRPRGSNNNPKIVETIINTQNEQELIAYLQQRFGWDANHPNLTILVTFPNYINVIIDYIGSSESVQTFIDFINTYGLALQLSTDELVQIINLKPQGIGKINLSILDNYLNSHNADATSSFVFSEVLRLLDNNPELTSAAPSRLDAFYRALSPAVMTWIQGPAKNNFRIGINNYLIDGPSEEAEERRLTVTGVINMNVEHGLDFESGAITFLINNSLHKDHIQTFLGNHPDDAAAADFITEHGNALGSDAEYAAFIESTAGFTPVMWAISKELIGDKVIDIVLRFIPGFGQADNVKDAIKAISHGDPLEFFFEVSQIVLNNSPLGNWLKAWNAVDELHDLYKKIDRIWDKIGNFTEEAVEQMWTIIKRYPNALWTNADLMGSIAKAIHRGIKSIDEVMASIPGFTQISTQRMRHILHGDAGGGLHHASGLVNNPAIEVIEHIAPNAKGVYKVRYKSPNGQEKLSSMFPDNKSEIGVAKSIENVYNNNITMPFTKQGFPGRRWISGKDSGGLDIEIEIDINNNVLTGYPLFN